MKKFFLNLFRFLGLRPLASRFKPVADLDLSSGLILEMIVDLIPSKSQFIVRHGPKKDTLKIVFVSGVVLTAYFLKCIG